MHENPASLKPVDVSVAPGLNVLTELGNVYRAPGVNQHVFSAITANPSKEKKKNSAVNMSGASPCKPQSSNAIVIWVVSGVLLVFRLLIQVKQSQPKVTGILDWTYVFGLFFNANVWNLESSVLLSVNLMITNRSNNNSPI